MKNRLHVGNLSYDVTTDALRASFAECGEVADMHEDRNAAGGRHGW